MRNPEAIAWAIATDGWISIERTWRDERRCFKVVVGFSNTRKDICVRLCEMVGFGKVSPIQTTYGESYLWRLTDLKGCLRFLEEILPYLPIKRRRAQTMIDFCQSRLSRRGIPYNNYELDLIDDMEYYNRKRSRFE